MKKLKAMRKVFAMLIPLVIVFTTTSNAQSEKKVPPPPPPPKPMNISVKFAPPKISNEVVPPVKPKQEIDAIPTIKDKKEDEFYKRNPSVSAISQEGNIITLTKKDGTKESFDMNNKEEGKKLTEKYGALPIAPPPPPPPKRLS